MEMPGGQDNVPSVTCPVRHKFISQKHCITNQEILLINNIIETDYVCNIFHGLGNIIIHFIDEKNVKCPVRHKNTIFWLFATSRLLQMSF